MVDNMIHLNDVNEVLSKYTLIEDFFYYIVDENSVENYISYKLKNLFNGCTPTTYHTNNLYFFIKNHEFLKGSILKLDHFNLIDIKGKNNFSLKLKFKNNRTNRTFSLNYEDVSLVYNYIGPEIVIDSYQDNANFVLDAYDTEVYVNDLIVYYDNGTDKRYFSALNFGKVTKIITSSTIEIVNMVNDKKEFIRDKKHFVKVDGDLKYNIFMAKLKNQ